MAKLTEVEKMANAQMRALKSIETKEAKAYALAERKTMLEEKRLAIKIVSNAIKNAIMKDARDSIAVIKATEKARKQFEHLLKETEKKMLKQEQEKKKEEKKKSKI